MIKCSHQWPMARYEVGARNPSQATSALYRFPRLPVAATSRQYFLGENCSVRTDLCAVGREHIVYEVISPSAAAIVRIQKPVCQVSVKACPRHTICATKPRPCDTYRTILRDRSLMDTNMIPTSSIRPALHTCSWKKIPGHRIHRLRIPESYVRHVYSQISNIVLQLSQL